MSHAHAAIANILYRYAELIDAGDFDAIGELFQHAVLESEGRATSTVGAAAIARQYHETTRRYPDTGTPKTKHVITNLLCEVDEAAGSARSRAYYTVLQATESLPLQPVITGRYHSEYRCVAGEWRIVRHRFFVDQVGDLSQHLRIDLARAIQGGS